MSTRQDKFNTNGVLSQEQLNNARKLWRRLDRPGDDIPSDVNDIGDIGELKSVYKDLLSARIEAGLDGLHKVAKALKSDYPILDELRKESRYKPVTLLEMAQRPKPKWIIKDFLYEKTDAVLYGPSGCKKSFMSLDWCASIAMGIDWQGHEISKPGKVVYLIAEGAGMFMQRVYAWCEYHAVRIEDLSKNLFLVPEELPLTNTAEVDEYISTISEYLYNVAPDIVVFDTLLRCATGQNINAPDVMSAIYAGAHKIRTSLDAAISLTIHHEGKDRSKGSAGSFVLKADMDIVHRMDCDKATGLITLEHEKMKDKPELTHYFNTVVVPYGDDINNLDESSLVIVSATKPTKEPKFTATQTKMLLVLDEHKSLSYNQWQKKSLDEHSVKKPTFDENLRKLKDAGIVAPYGDGKTQGYRRPLQENGQPWPEQMSIDEEAEEDE